jgi:hypothetical protein
VATRVGKRINSVAWTVLGFSWFVLGLYALAAVTRFDWIGALVGIPAIGLMVLWNREEQARQAKAEEQRIAKGLPRAYDLNDIYKPHPSRPARNGLLEDTPGDDFESWLAGQRQP